MACGQLGRRVLVGTCGGVCVLVGTCDRFLRLHAELAQSQTGAGQREMSLLVPRVCCRYACCAQRVTSAGGCSMHCMERSAAFDAHAHV
jgi:hypothetical protein